MASRWSGTVAGGASCDRAQSGIVELAAWGRACLALKRCQTTIGDLQVIGGIKKLNSQNYNTWSTCMKSYLQGQDL